jgi:hypothetical protein
MTWRKWLVRGFVFTLAGGVVVAGLLWEAWTNPAATRRMVLAKLADKFVAATVSLESARLRLLGGIAVSDLRMARRDDLDKGDFLYVPSAVIYHDKEQVLDGKLQIRKIELFRPRLRVVRERDGRVNLQGLTGPLNPDEKLPTVVLQNATVLVEDRGAAPGTPLLEIKDLNLTVRNDPLTLLTIDGAGRTDVAGPLRFNARVHRPTDTALATFELPDAPVGPALVERLAAVCPEAAVHLRQLRGTASLQGTLARQPGSSYPLAYDVTLKLRDGSFSHARLPLSLEGIEGSLQVINGHVPVARVTARSGSARIAVTARDAAWPGHKPTNLDEVVRELETQVEHLAVTPELLAELPGTCPEMGHDYSPRGPVSFDYTYSRNAEGRWRKHWHIVPEGVSGEFFAFRYPVEAVGGFIDVDLNSEKDNRVVVELEGRAGGQPVDLKGQSRGEKGRAGVDMVLEGRNLVLDDKVFRALPAKSQEVARKFLPEVSRQEGLRTRPMGLADLTVNIHRTRGHTKFANRYVIAFHESAVKYDLFPYPLSGVRGVLDIQPDHWECKDFRGTYHGGEIRFEGRSFHAAAPGVRTCEASSAEGRVERADRVQVTVYGKNVLLDREFEQALAPPESPGRAALLHTWKTLAMQGRMDFTARVIDQPDAPQDIDVWVDVRGPGMRPAFFPYRMSDVRGTVRYAKGRVDVADVTARHGPAALGLKSGLVVLKPGGGFQGWFEGIRGTGLAPDAEFIRALPPTLAKGFEPMHLERPLDVLTSLTVETWRDSDRLKVWWDGAAALRDALLKAGVQLSDVKGQIASHGYFDGQQVERLDGDIFLEQATVLGQPFRNLHARLQVHPDYPNQLRLCDLKADLFGGTVGGEARLDIGPNLRYEVLLEALQIRLEQFGKHNFGNTAELLGPARAALYLAGEGTDLSGLRGNGRIQVDNGKMLRLPLLLDLLKAFGLRMPDRTAFEQARVVFAVAGPQMRIQQLDLFGSAVSLRGQGTLNLDDNDINLDFSADWGRVPQVLPPGISDLSQALSDQMFRIKMRGQVGAVKYEKELLPGVLDPLKKVMGRAP